MAGGLFAGATRDVRIRTRDRGNGRWSVPGPPLASSGIRNPVTASMSRPVYEDFPEMWIGKSAGGVRKTSLSPDGRAVGAGSRIELFQGLVFSKMNAAPLSLPLSSVPGAPTRASMPAKATEYPNTS